MRAVQYDRFGSMPVIVELPTPEAPVDGVVVTVRATGVCRSDWHAWKGHDDSVSLPTRAGPRVLGDRVGRRRRRHRLRRRRPGDRAVRLRLRYVRAVPRRGHAGVHPAAAARVHAAGLVPEAVVVPHADVNLVALPDEVGFAEAAGLGCRFGTAYHALHARGRVAAGEWVAVFGCGGVGLSTVLVAVAAGARVVAVDVSPAALERAAALGATTLPMGEDVAATVHGVTGGGAHVSVDAYGSRATSLAAVGSLRPRGRHVQVGLLLDDEAVPVIPMGRVIADELELLGSHGIAVGEYAAMLDDVVAGRLRPAESIGRTIGFGDLPDALEAMDRPATGSGMTVAVF